MRGDTVFGALALGSRERGGFSDSQMALLQTLCDAYGATVYEFDGTLIHYRAATGVSDDPTVRAAIKSMP